MVRLVDVSELRIAGDAPHPDIGCRCQEGRVVNEFNKVVCWLPAVHDCAYVAERDRRLAVLPSLWVG